MKRVLFTIVVLFTISSVIANAQMKLNLSNDLTMERQVTFGNHNLETNLKLDLPQQLVNPSNMELVKGLFVLGLLADVTFPIGTDFSNFAGTGFSGHLLLGYLVSRSIMLTLSGGYIRFGDKDFGDGQFFTQTWTHSQIPILLGMNYFFNMRGAFRAYLGFALGLFLLSDSYTETTNYGGQSETIDGSSTDSKFGIAPRLGFIYMTAAILWTLEVTYSYIFHESEGEGSSKLQHFGILAGLMFPLGK